MTRDGAPASRFAAALVALLAIPFDPHWIDFEAARRGILLAVLGAMALLRPTAFARDAKGGAWLIGLSLWLAISAMLGHGDTQFDAAIQRLAWWSSLWLLWRAGSVADKGALAFCAAGTLCVAALTTVAQRLGMPFWIGSAEEPVSWFGNRNVAAEFLAIAATVVAAHPWTRPRLALLALGFAGLGLAANGSRSGLVAMPIGVAIAAFATRSDASPSLRNRAMPIVAALAGIALGMLWLHAPVAQDPAKAMPGSATRTVTLEVRAEIATSGLRMWRDEPLLGHGPGQFAVEYPRYRSQREIELSSMNRAEMRRVGTAHDDWLETAIEGGLPALLLLLAFFSSRLLRRPLDASAAPLIALAALMCIRAPILNAPAVALALLYASRPSETVRDLLPQPRKLALRALGVLLLALGASTIAAAFCVARYLESTARPEGPTIAWLERSISAQPSDPTTRQLLATELLRTATSRAEAERALPHADQAVALRPHEPSYRLLRADALRLCGRTQDAKQDLAMVAKVDPGEPQTQIQLAGLYATEGDFEAALIALCTDPPPMLRTKLAEQLRLLAMAAESAGKNLDRDRLLAEAAFVRALDALREGTARGDMLAKARIDEMRQSFATAKLDPALLRTHALLALLALRTGQSSVVDSFADLAQKRGGSLTQWEWSLMREVAEPLRSVASWQPLLPSN